MTLLSKPKNACNTCKTWAKNPKKTSPSMPKSYQLTHRVTPNDALRYENVASWWWTKLSLTSFNRHVDRVNCSTIESPWKYCCHNRIIFHNK